LFVLIIVVLEVHCDIYKSPSAYVNEANFGKFPVLRGLELIPSPPPPPTPGRGNRLKVDLITNGQQFDQPSLCN
jgi:hypothetical protein